MISIQKLPEYVTRALEEATNKADTGNPSEIKIAGEKLNEIHDLLRDAPGTWRLNNNWKDSRNKYIEAFNMLSLTMLEYGISLKKSM